MNPVQWIALMMQKIDQSGVVDTIQLVIWICILLELVIK